MPRRRERDRHPGQRPDGREQAPRRERGLPGPEQAGQRHRQRGRRRRAAHHGEHVEPGDEPGPVRREERLDQTGQERATDGDAEAGQERPGIQHPGGVAPEPDADAGEHGEYGELDARRRAMAAGQPLRGRCEQPHAQDGERGQGTHARVAQVQVGDDLVAQGRHAGDGDPHVRRDGEQGEAEQRDRWETGRGGVGAQRRAGSGHCPAFSQPGVTPLRCRVRGRGAGAGGAAHGEQGTVRVGRRQQAPGADGRRRVRCRGRGRPGRPRPASGPVPRRTTGRSA